ncbi:cupin domain-containing protein [Sinorhizobium alkalisoli]|uniref:Uncharacterized protein n=1 Tax=Sinorhizobium alkalisoli TaxID=1752398 RepID=A0A1E3VFQ6_9HYPH|nr:cupin domain-containing protein [Sinorhizobium alkalisoli]MCA1491776.1 cupin domain-containing protein [Ensifer sp. NBAIM29]MCG5479230.1 cupin domain-containing protein [Sinorhizobium alkalisoli]ODR92398.1 hypothetical protein A8M32_05000 [Sinorhizobium alkalisoli]QFI66919.1 hypothetical protein EKH55_2045 [Sinorhizobium alkalisoli]
MNTSIGISDPDGLDSLWVVRDRITFRGEVADTGLSIVDVEVPPQSGTPPHRHPSPEIFRVLDGEITFGLFNEIPPREIVAGPGTVVTVPSNTPHNYLNASGRSATMMVVVEKQMADFFRDLGRSETPVGGPPDEGEIAAIMAACQRHDIEILGGPPA